MKRISLYFIVGIMTACASGPYPVSSPYFQIPAGSRLKLNQALTIPPDSGRVYIQYGKVVSDRKKDQYYPHCWFVSWKISSTETIIQPDEFIITSSKQDESYVSIQQPLLLAGTILALKSAMSSGATAIEYFTILSIHSDRQPNIRQLICNHWEDPADAKHLTLAQINKTLGTIAQISLPE